MCTISAIGDNWRDQFPDRHRWVQQYISPAPYPNPAIPAWPPAIPFEAASKTEVDALRAEMKELRELLMAAKRFDEKTGQPNCELDDKVALIKKVAELVGVSMDDVFKAQS